MKNKPYLTKSPFVYFFLFLLSCLGVRSQVDVMATGGTPFSSYPTLNDAFMAINSGTHMGSITVDIYVSTTEIGPCILNSSGAGLASYNSVLVRPANDGVTVSGPTATGRGLIELNGADTVTIDGDNPNTPGINRNLTLTNTATNTTTYTSVVRVALSSMVTSANNISVKNLIINGSATGRNISTATSTVGSEYTTFGIVVAGSASTVSATSPPNGIASTVSNPTTGQTANNFYADNNEINSVARGIICNGSVTSVYGGANALRITNNTIGNGTAAATNQVYSVGISAQGMGTTTGSVISGNTVYVEGYVATAIRGIDVGFASTSSMNLTIENNKVLRVYQRYTGSGQGTYGIQIAGTTGSGHIVRNNFITDINNTIVTSSVSSLSGVFGIRLSSGTNYKVHNNSVNLFGPFLSGSSNSLSACLNFYSTVTTGCDVRNNIFSNTKSGASATSIYACVFFPTTTLTSSYNLTLNNNAYYQGTVAGQSGIAQASITFSAANLYTAVNFNPAVTTPSTNLRSYTSLMSLAGTNDNGSYASTSPAPYTSNSDLHLNLGSAEIISVEQKGDASVPVTTDIDADVRPNVGTTLPDMGADEVALPNCTTANAGTVTPATINTCNGLTATISSTGATVGTGMTYQWQVSSTAGGPYTNVSGGIGGNSTSHTTGTLTTGTYYYVLQATCSFGGSGTSNEVTVNVNANPVVTVSPTTATYCSGGAGVSITASGASTYSWLPAAGLSATTGATVVSSPTVATTYTVTGTDVNGCINTAVTIISVEETPVSSVVATPTAVCTGGNSQLNVTASLSGTSYNVTSIPHGPQTDPGGTSIITGDDGVTAAIALPFSFTFYGTTYNQIFVYTNGFIQLGTSSGSTFTYGQLLPSAAAPNGVIGGVWADLNVTGAAAIRTYTTGTAPNRIFTIHWDNVPFYFTTGNNNFYIELFETTNIVEVHITDASGSAGNKTCGIESATGANAATPPGHNLANWSVTTPEAWRFSPAGYPLSYLWSPSTYLNSTTINNPLASAIASTITYTVNVSSSGGCVATNTVTVSAGIPLSSSASVTPSNTVCAGTNPSLNATAIDGGSPFTYSWAGPNSYSSALQNPVLTNIQPTDAGTYTVTVNDNCGNTSSAQVTVTVDPQPALSVTPTNTFICNPGGTAVTLNASGASVSYSWLPTTGLSPTTGATVSALPAATTIYTVTGTGSNGCITTATATVMVGNYPTISSVTASPSNICPNGTSTLTATAGAGTYCTGLYSSGTSASDYIINVTLGTINNTTGASAAPYNTYYSALNTNLTAGTTYTVTGTLNNAGTEYVAIWIDYNQDGVFAATEKIGEQALLSFSIPFTVPAGAINGQTRMRVRNVYGTSGILPCNSYTWGEVEDYNVTISGGLNAAGYSWSPSTFLSSSTANPTVASSVTSATNYTVTVTSPEGCVSTGTVALTMDPLSAVGIVTTPSTTVCEGTSITLNSSVTGGGQPLTYAWSTGDVTASSMQAPSVTTTYSLTVTDNCGASMGASQLITVHPNPIISVTPDTALFCNPGAGVLMVASGAETYTWTPATGLSATTGDSVTANPTTTTSYFVSGTDTNGCVSGKTALINSATGVTVSSVTANPSVLCSGDTSTLVATSAAAIAPSAYCQPVTSCTSSDQITNVTFATINRTSTCDATTGGYSYWPAFNPTINAGTTYTVSVTTSASWSQGAAVWFDWNQDGVFAATEMMLNGYLGTAPATYTAAITVPVTAFNGQTRMRVRCRYAGNPSTLGPCANTTYGETEDYLITISGGSTVASYAWTPATYLNNTTNDTVVAAAMMTSETYVVMATNATGCTDTGSVSITVNPTPVAPTVANGEICSGFTSTLNASGTGTLGWYDANSAGNYLAGGASFTTPNLTATDTFYVQDSSSAGCIGPRAEVTVIVNPNPVVNLGTDTTRCGGTVTLDAQNPGVTYAWSTTEMTQTITVDTTGTYQVAITDTNGCMDIDTINVIINPIPVVALGTDLDVCEDTVQLDAQNSGNTYLWNTTETTQMITVTSSGSYDVIVTTPQGCNGYDTIGVILRTPPVVNLGNDTTMCGGNLLLDAQNAGSNFVWNDASTASINFVTSTGIYWVDVTTPQNCTVRDSITVTINPMPVVNLGPNISACNGDTVVLDAGMTAGATYLWNDASSNQTLTTDTSGTFYVSVTTGPNCAASDTVSVTVNPNPVVTFAIVPDSICENASPLMMSGESPAGGSFAGSGVNGNLFDPTGVTGSSIITYNYTDNNGCSGSAVDTITLISAPAVTLSLSQDTACANDGIVTLGGESPAGGTFSGTSVSGNSFNPTVGAGTYVISYTYVDSSTGCSNTATDNFVVDVCAGAAFDYLSTLNVYPNPNKGEFFIEFATGEGTPLAEIFTLQGKLVFSRQLDATTRNVIGVKELSNGIYVLRITHEGRVKNVKLTITQ